MTRANGHPPQYHRDPAAHPGAAAPVSPYAGRVAPSGMPEEPAVTPAEREAAAKSAAAKQAADKSAAAKAEAARIAAADKGQGKTAAMSVKTANGEGKAVPVAGGGGLIQLGAFSSEGAANKAWASLSKRFAYLTELNR